ncbi:MAG: 3-hydroxyacyl-CoA dehydrogenase NAD-binding domain-containing protein [Acidobacteriota bacterium]
MQRTLPPRSTPPSDQGVTTVAIIGAGPLGRWLALAAARAGFCVLLEDVMPQNLDHAQEYIRQQLSADALSREQGTQIAFVSSIEDAVRQADLIIDCVPDELESKLEILWLLDRMAPPRAVFATPTTRLSISDLAACTYRADKCIAIAATPAALSQLATAPGAEIPHRTAPATAPETVALLTTFWQRLDFTPTFEA